MCKGNVQSTGLSLNNWALSLQCDAFVWSPELTEYKSYPSSMTPNLNNKHAKFGKQIFDITDVPCSQTQILKYYELLKLCYDSPRVIPSRLHPEK